MGEETDGACAISDKGSDCADAYLFLITRLNEKRLRIFKYILLNDEFGRKMR
jgi:hypothetical protein